MSKERTCLRCQKQFESSGPFHRICDYCKRMNQKHPYTKSVQSNAGRVVRSFKEDY